MSTTIESRSDSDPSVSRAVLIRPAKVAALVLNSVDHDARVLKEADSLAGMGLDVTIVGVQDARCGDRQGMRPSGVRIRRADYQAFLRFARELRRYRFWSAILAVSVLIAIGSLAGLFRPMLQPMIALVEWMGGLVPFVVLLGASMILALAARRVRTHGRVLEKLAVVVTIPGRGPSGTWWTRTWRKTVRPLGRVREVLGGRLRVALHRSRQRSIESMYLSELARLEPDVVHCHDLTTLSSGVEWCRRSPATRLVLDSHELYEEVARMPPPLRAFWQGKLRDAASSVDGFITVNDGIAAEYRRRYPELPEAVVIRNAVRRPDGPPKRDGRLREAAGLGPDRLILLYQGGFAAERGLESLVTAAGDLPNPWVLVMMGWGSIEPELRRLASEVDPGGDRIRFVPGAPQDELGVWTSDADLGVIPYENTCMNHWLCSPNKLWEYPVAGVPMLVSDFPILREVAVGEGVGLVLPDRLDGPSLAGLLRSITSDDLARMRHACEAFIARDNWSMYECRLRSLYRRLLDD